MTSKDLLAAASGHNTSWVECSECGHIHFNTKTLRYDECPLRHDGCTCPFAEGDKR